MKTKPITDIEHEIGRCYMARTGHPELSSHKGASSAVVLEDGVALPGPPNALHDDIRRAGGGRYCFWHHKVYFSTPDNSDPGSNGRTYAIGYAPVPRNILLVIALDAMEQAYALWARPVMRAVGRTKPVRMTWNWAGRAVRAGRRIVPFRSVSQFCARWTGRAIRLSRRLRPVPIFWGSLYWICFGTVLVRGEVRRALKRRGR